MFVYTFWEPRTSIPYYLQMCMETWKKYLPNATIVLLDYKNLRDFVDMRDIGLKLLSGRFSFSQFSDALRVALLAKHGGVWIDIDTIILNSSAEKYFLPDEKHRTIFFADIANKTCQTAFINSSSGAMCMKLWLSCIRENVWNLTPTTSINGNFMGKAFISEYVQKYPDEMKLFDPKSVMPEIKNGVAATSFQDAYVDYYFKQNLHSADVNADMLLLHNSWTPQIFKQWSDKEVLSCDCTMTNILAEALGISLPPPQSRSRFGVEGKK